jgi:3-oxoacyl-[acyl-carrier protein] reductase
MARTATPVAIVTGAGSPGGIGFATALRLAGRGAHVVLVGTTDRVLERASEVATDGQRATGVVADLRNEQAVDEVASIAASLGLIEVLVNNAGMTSI